MVWRVLRSSFEEVCRERRFGEFFGGCKVEVQNPGWRSVRARATKKKRVLQGRGRGGAALRIIHTCKGEECFQVVACESARARLRGAWDHRDVLGLARECACAVVVPVNLSMGLTFDLRFLIGVGLAVAIFNSLCVESLSLPLKMAASHGGMRRSARA
eukprot:6211858-Pleurochrysis_carterae.AAC.4